MIVKNGVTLSESFACAFWMAKLFRPTVNMRSRALRLMWTIYETLAEICFEQCSTRC